MGKDAIEMNATVKECFTNHFKLECDNGHEVIAYLAGKMRRYYIKVMPGDRVTVEISPYDLTKGRITKRLKPEKMRISQEAQNDASQGGSDQASSDNSESSE
ncbi:MAG: translation initiation factor IF-1 [Bdellovibrionales bacterium]|nr:translation initiation factor IF-1 [Bdellovibrionales bacterium]